MILELSNTLTKTLINELRDTKTDALKFKHIIKELTKQLLYEALKEFPPQPKSIDTWQGNKEFDFISADDLIVVTVLRAGMPMLESVCETLPDITAGFLAMKRDEETHKSVLYYDRVPECKGKTAILVDPMVATGGSLCDAIDVLHDKEVKKIITLNIIGCPEGLDKIHSKYQDIDTYIAQIDERLNDDKFILPGLGDAGDRSYNTL